jgi:hypothetical protein
MSETTDAPQPGGGAAAPDAADTTTFAPGGAPGGTPGGAGDDAGADTTQTTTETPETPEEAAARVERATQRRMAKLTARVSAQQAELEQLRRGQPQPQQRQGEPQLTQEQQAYVDQRVAAEVARTATQERAKAFHAAGEALHQDWKERCASLMEMGADAQLAELLVEIPDGAKVAGALADNPEELERIAGLKTERARAIALGKYAATLAASAVPRRGAAANLSRAPAPIRPIGNAPARAEFNEFTASADELAEYYAKQAMDARKRG